MIVLIEKKWVFNSSKQTIVIKTIYLLTHNAICMNKVYMLYTESLCYSAGTHDGCAKPLATA